MAVEPAQLRVETQGKVPATISAGQIPVLEVEEEAWIKTTELKKLTAAAKEQCTRSPAGRSSSLRGKSGDAVWDQPVEELRYRFLSKRGFSPQRGLTGVSAFGEPAASETE